MGGYYGAIEKSQPIYSSKHQLTHKSIFTLAKNHLKFGMYQLWIFSNHTFNGLDVHNLYNIRY